MGAKLLTPGEVDFLQEIIDLLRDVVFKSRFRKTQALIRKPVWVFSRVPEAAIAW